jgi:hypothetical protein
MRFGREIALTLEARFPEVSRLAASLAEAS